MAWLDKLESRWNVSSGQVIKILIVFACTGMTIVWLKKPVLEWIDVSDDRQWLFSVLYFILILPIYNVVLLIYGYLFGEFPFFWNYEKRFFKRIFRRP